MPVIFCLCTFFTAFSQKMTVQNYIDTYKGTAIIEMKRAGVPVAITLAQGILETESGNSVLVKKSNNHFGIKCKAEWTGESVYHDDDENGECFRKYDSAIQSYRDHSDFLRTRPHYAFLFSLDPSDYKGWAYGLKKAGYATNPKYPQILIKTIEDYHLNEITIETLNGISDYSVFKLDNNKSNIPIIDKSLSKLNQIIEPQKIKAKTYNGLKALLVDSGISLLAIATKYNIALSSLLDYNDLLIDGLLATQSWVYLERKGTEGLQDTYTVKANESLLEISQSNAIQLSYLLAYNGLNENDKIKPGTVLSLRSTVFIKDKADNSNETLHEVKQNESLFTISKKYKVAVANLKEWNNLNSNNLKVGQKLIISK